MISLNPSLTIYCNDFPKIEPRDCFDNCNLIRTHYGFNDIKVDEGNSLYKKTIKIDNLDPKDYIIKNRDDIRDAFLWLILDNYEDGRIVKPAKMIEQLQKNNEIYNQNDIVSIINEYFEKAEDNTKNRLTKNDISKFKKNLYIFGDKKLGIMKDTDIVDKLGKFYEYRKQRCKTNKNNPCYCFTGIKIKKEFLEYHHFIDDDTNSEGDDKVENEVVENEVVENEIIDTENNDEPIVKHLIPRKKVKR